MYVTSSCLWCILISHQNKCEAIRTRKCRSTNWLTSYMLSIVRNPNFFKGGGEKILITSPSGEEIWNFENRGGSAGTGVFLKGGDWHFPYLIFSRFIIFTSRNYFTHCKTVLPMNLTFKEKKFSATIILCNKVILFYIKNKPEKIPYIKINYLYGDNKLSRTFCFIKI